MSKGNKESKKPKQAPAKTPAAGVATPPPGNASRPQPRKKWPTT